MSELISRKAVYNMLNGLGGCDAQDEWSKGWDKAIDTAIDGLGNIPTVYDVDKVVERLKKHWCKDCRKQEMCKDCHIKEFVLDIVKGCGQG